MLRPSMDRGGQLGGQSASPGTLSTAGLVSQSARHQEGGASGSPRGHHAPHPPQAAPGNEYVLMLKRTRG